MALNVHGYAIYLRHLLWRCVCIYRRGRYCLFLVKGLGRTLEWKMSVNNVHAFFVPVRKGYNNITMENAENPKESRQIMIYVK